MATVQQFDLLQKSAVTQIQADLEAAVEADRIAAQAAASTATTKANEASASSVKASQWAENNEDVAVETGKFSAKHYSIKAETAWDNFDDTYLGAKATDPTTDNDGGVLKVGAMYFNSVSKIFKVWDGSAWITNPSLESARSQSTTTVPSSKLLDDEIQFATQYAINGRQLLPLDSRVTPSELTRYGLSPNNPLGGSYTYINNVSAITSNVRLGGVHIYALKDGTAYIDFIKLGGAEPMVAIYLNEKSQNLVSLKAGWNYIPDNQIVFPLFDGTAYIGVRPIENGVLGYNGQGEGLSIEVNGGDNTANYVVWKNAYYIDRYDYDIYTELANYKTIELPRGQIDITRTINISNQRVKGAGIMHTFLCNRITTGSNIMITLNSYGELSDVLIQGKSYLISKDTDVYNSVTDIINEAGMDFTAEYGVNINGIGVRFTDSMVKHCGCYGVYIEGQSARMIHSYIRDIQCSENFIGFKFSNSGEYCILNGLSASNNVLGIKIGAGNLFFSSCAFNDNRVGLHMYKTGNDAHGSFAASQFNHNLKFSMFLDQISHGETFVGCHVFEGDIYLKNSIGFNFNGGTIDANILVEGGKTQLVQGTSFQNAYWNRASGISHNYNGVTSYLKMKNNFFMLETGENDAIINN